MKIKQNPSLRFITFNVGHGDAILLQWIDNEKSWVALVDGGESLELILRCLAKARIDKLDLLVSTHLDSDHNGGLIGLSEKIKVMEYWGPALPAFERHKWLFGDRCIVSIERGREIESSLLKSNTNIIYPLEGYSSFPLGHEGPKLNILSPPPKLIKTLILEKDIIRLTTGHTTPLGWLTNNTQTENKEQNSDFAWLDSEIKQGALTPESLNNRVHQYEPNINSIKKIQKKWSKKYNQEPEFFGNSLLNNTSIVIWFEVIAGANNHRILLTGDQENWTYLLAANSRGLQPDIMKAPHHGGRIYLESKQCEQELCGFIKPKVITISANGTHMLPRNCFRNAAVTWGTTIFCTSNRGAEFIGNNMFEDKSCHNCYDCIDGQDVELRLNAKGISATKQACHSGFGTSIGPIIQIRQHIVNPSPIVQQLFENELRRYIKWVKDLLIKIHSERLIQYPFTEPYNVPVNIKHIECSVREKHMHSLLPHLKQVLIEGKKRNQFWTSENYSYNDSSTEVYCLPSEEEIKEFISLVQSKSFLLFDNGVDLIRFDKTTFLASLPNSGLALFAEAFMKFPRKVFHEALWPYLLNEFKNDWNCYINDKGVIALIPKNRTIAKFYQKIFKFYGRYSDTFSKQKWINLINLRQEVDYLNAPFIANSRERVNRSTELEYSWEEIIKNWLTPSQQVLEFNGWQKKSWNDEKFWHNKNMTIELETNYVHTSYYSYIKELTVKEGDSKKYLSVVLTLLKSGLKKVW